jgi:hypothetical protein
MASQVKKLKILVNGMTQDTDIIRNSRIALRGQIAFLIFLVLREPGVDLFGDDNGVCLAFRF